MNLRWPDAVGLLGVVLVLLAYFLLQAGRLRGNALPYQLLNAAGALFVLLSLLYAFNLPAFLMELAWVLVSIYGIAWNRRRRA
jgi:hypothetical protein